MQARGHQDYNDDRAKLTNFLQHKPTRQTTQFISKVPRMRKPHQQQSQLGPGQYKVEPTNFKRRTYNVKSEFFGRGKQRKNQKNRAGTNKFLGPEAYYPNYDLTKMKRTQDILF